MQVDLTENSLLSVCACLRLSAEIFFRTFEIISWGKNPGHYGTTTGLDPVVFFLLTFDSISAVAELFTPGWKHCHLLLLVRAVQRSSGRYCT